MWLGGKTKLRRGRRWRSGGAAGLGAVGECCRWVLGVGQRSELGGGSGTIRDATAVLRDPPGTPLLPELLGPWVIPLLPTVHPGRTDGSSVPPSPGHPPLQHSGVPSPRVQRPDPQLLHPPRCSSRCYPLSPDVPLPVPLAAPPGSSRTGRRRQPHLPAPRPHLTGLISIPPALRHAIGPSFPFVYISGREGTSERLSARQWAGLRAHLHIGRAQRLPPLSPRGAGAGGAGGGGRSGVRSRRYRSRVRAAGRDPGPSLSSQARVTLTGFRTELLVLLYSYVSVVSCPRCWLRVMAA